MRALSLSMLLIACGPGPVDVCATTSPGPRRAAEVGLYDFAVETFTPYGDETRLIAGFQGGYMVTPVIRFAAQDSDVPAPCLNVRIDNALNGSPGPSLSFSVIAEAEDGMYQINRIDNFLGNVRGQLVGQTLTMDIEIIAEDFTIQEMVQVRLTPNL